MMERAILAEEGLQEILVEYQNMWEYLEAVSVSERAPLLERKARRNIGEACI